MSSLTRTARRAHQRKTTPPRKPALNPGKRDPRPFIASMLTAVDWPVFVAVVNQTLTKRDYRERYGVSRSGIATARAEWLDKRREAQQDRAMKRAGAHFLTGVFDAMKRAGAQEIDLRDVA